MKKILSIIIAMFSFMLVTAQLDTNRPMDTIRYQNIHFVIDQGASSSGIDVIEYYHYKSLILFQKALLVDTRVKALKIVLRTDNELTTDLSGINGQSDIGNFTNWVLNSSNNCDTRDIQTFVTSATGETGTTGNSIAGEAMGTLINGYAITTLYQGPRYDYVLAHEWAHAIGALSGDHRESVSGFSMLNIYDQSPYLLLNFTPSTSIGYAYLTADMGPYFSVPSSYNSFSVANGGNGLLHDFYYAGHKDIPITYMDNTVSPQSLAYISLTNDQTSVLDTFAWCGTQNSNYKNTMVINNFPNVTSGIVEHYQNHMDYLRKEPVAPLVTPQISLYHGKINVSNLQDFDNKYPMTTNANYQDLYYMPGDYQVYVYDASNTANDAYIAGPYPLGQIIKGLSPGNYAVRVYEVWSNNLSPASAPVTIDATQASCQDITVSLDANGQAVISEDAVENGSTGYLLNFDTEPNVFSCADLGDNTVTLTVTGSTGTDTCTATVTVVDDMAPVPDTDPLSDVHVQCEVTSLTPPTATDNCSSNVTVTHDATLPITGEGTTVLVTWTYDDGNGNTATQTQNIIIDDTTPPVPDAATLPDVVSECEVTSLTPPTATDNCSSNVTVTHDATLPVTTQGTTVVTWTYDDGNGNTATQTQNVIITPIDNSVSVSGNVLTANATGNYTYQWGDCSNGNFTVINGATGQTYTATQTGDYAVEIDNGTCSVTSDCIHVTVSGIADLEKEGIKIYPNPSGGLFTVELERPSLVDKIFIIDTQGKILLEKTSLKKINRFNILEFAKAVYLLQIVEKDKIYNVRIVKR